MSRENWACGICRHDVWFTHSLNLRECTECPDGECQVPVARCHWDNEKICEPVARMDHVFCSWSCYEEWMESFL